MDLAYLFKSIILNIVNPVLNWGVTFGEVHITFAMIIILGGLIWIVKNFIQTLLN